MKGLPGFFNPLGDHPVAQKPMAEVREEECPKPESVEAALQGLVGSKIDCIAISETETDSVLGIYTEWGLIQITCLKSEHIGICVRLAEQAVEWQKAQQSGSVQW